MIERTFTPDEVDIMADKARTEFVNLCLDTGISDEQKIDVMTAQKSVNEIREELQLPPLEGHAYDMMLFIEPDSVAPCLSEACLVKARISIAERSASEADSDYRQKFRDIFRRNIGIFLREI